jgi:hypothetical protein
MHTPAASEADSGQLSCQGQSSLQCLLKAIRSFNCLSCACSCHCLRGQAAHCTVCCLRRCEGHLVHGMLLAHTAAQSQVRNGSGGQGACNNDTGARSLCPDSVHACGRACMAQGYGMSAHCAASLSHFVRSGYNLHEHRGHARALSATLQVLVRASARTLPGQPCGHPGRPAAGPSGSDLRLPASALGMQQSA